MFTQVRNGDLPGQILYQDELVFVILSIAPHNPGHCLIIPVQEVADLEALNNALYERTMQIAHQFMKVLKAVYSPPKVAVVVSGADLPDHCHVHVFPQYESKDIDSSRAHQVDQVVLKLEADKIRAYLKERPIV